MERYGRIKSVCLIVSMFIAFSLVVVGCGKNSSASQPPATPSVAESIDEDGSTDGQSDRGVAVSGQGAQEEEESKTIIDVKEEPVVDYRIPDPNESSTIINISPTNAGSLPISVTETTYLDSHGVQVIEKVYIMPYTGDIMDVASRRLLVNGIEYVLHNVSKAQSVIDKVHYVERVEMSEDAALDFPQKLEYDGPDGIGVLELDRHSITSGVNNTTTETHGRSATKTYTMNIKDESEIPATVVSGGVTLRKQSVSWNDMGDAGEGRIFEATVRYSGTYQTSESDYIASANYVGRILATNSPVEEYTVTYKPSTPVGNTSGQFSTDLQNRLYPTVDQELRDWQEAQFRMGVEDSVVAMQTDINELRSAAIAMSNTSRVMFMVMIIVLVILILGILVFVILKIKDAPNKGFRMAGRRSTEKPGTIVSSDGEVSDDETL